MNPATATPAEIDTALAELFRAMYRINARIAAAADDIHGCAGQRARYVRGGRVWPTTLEEAVATVQANLDSGATTGYMVRHHQEALARLAALRAESLANADAQSALQAEFFRRGEWTRAYAVAKGHIHRSMNCTTCYPTTEYGWLPQVSGWDEAAIVEAAGERACTICYPSAPVTDRPSRLWSLDEQQAREVAERERVERAAKAAAKAAKAITNPDGTPLLDCDGRPVATEIAAERNAVANLADARWYGPGGAYGERTDEHPSAPKWRAAAERAALALAHKRGQDPDEVRAQLAAKAEAKFARDMRKAARHR